MATFTWLWATGAPRHPGIPRLGSRKDPRGAPEDKTPVDSLGHRWGTRPWARQSGQRSGGRCHVTAQGSRPIKPLSVFLPRGSRKGTVTLYSCLSPHPLLVVLKMANIRRRGALPPLPHPARDSGSARAPLCAPPLPSSRVPARVAHWRRAPRGGARRGRARAPCINTGPRRPPPRSLRATRLS